MQQPAETSSFEFNHPTIVSLCYLGGFITGISALVGLILAYVWKGEPHEAWEMTHFRFHIRTFWFGLLASVAAALLSVILVGFLLFALIIIWWAVRTVKALLAAQKREPIADPESLLFG